MLEPPIDKIVTKIGCKYALCSLVTKRARFLLEKKPDVLDAAGRRAVTVASQEVFDGQIEVGIEE
ncbi:MAG: DNA-directed RNA polymerase subunit omega [Firmicutes bacterium]|nr:DNA-directed RNA polymerase subunit omega [Bacillota bacterium]MCL2256073.1 DNA-directed RNA polymerase subunit omega [Bacillota bacterium]